MAKKNRYTYNDKIFLPPFDDKSAYLLGFIAGDGYVSRFNVTIGLARADHGFLKRVARAFQTDKGIYEYADKKGHETSRLVISSRAIAKSLHNLGLYPAKSHTYEPDVTLACLPKSLRRHYWRGLFDADGCAGYYPNRKTCNMTLVGSKGTIRSFINMGFRVTGNKLNMHKCDNVYRAVFSGYKDSARLSDFLYRDARLFLGRKYNKACNIIDFYCNKGHKDIPPMKPWVKRKREEKNEELSGQCNLEV